MPSQIVTTFGSYATAPTQIVRLMMFSRLECVATECDHPVDSDDQSTRSDYSCAHTVVSCPRNKHMFRRRSVGCFSRRSEPDWRLRRAYLESIRKERATRKNSQLATAQRVAMKMGRPLRCSSVTYPFRYAPSFRQSGSDRLAGGPFLFQRNRWLFWGECIWF